MLHHVTSWADYDNDGFLDLYVGRYLDPRKKGFRPLSMHAMANRTSCTTTTREGRPAWAIRDGLGTVFGHYDDDGFPDLCMRSTTDRRAVHARFLDSGCLEY
jgi:hypothetical protein